MSHFKKIAGTFINAHAVSGYPTLVRDFQSIELNAPLIWFIRVPYGEHRVMIPIGEDKLEASKIVEAVTIWLNSFLS